MLINQDFKRECYSKNLTNLEASYFEDLVFFLGNDGKSFEGIHPLTNLKKIFQVRSAVGVKKILTRLQQKGCIVSEKVGKYQDNNRHIKVNPMYIPYFCPQEDFFL